MLKFKNFFVVSMIMSLGMFLVVNFVLAQQNNLESASSLNREELETRIKLQNEELEKLNRQMEETQSKLNGTKNERLSLQKELNKIKTSITQLNLGIKADQATINKLELEIDSLGYDIRDLEVLSDYKKQSVADVLRVINRNDQVNSLTLLLQGDSLADGIFELQALANTGSQLRTDIENLDLLRGKKIKKIDEVSVKKTELARRKDTLENRKTIIEDQENEKEIILIATKNKESIYQTEVEELQKRQEEISEQISKFEDELKDKFDAGLLPTKRSGVFEWPIVLKTNGGKGIITQHMGEVSGLYRGKPHNGLDIGVPLGTEVLAAEDGVVMAVDDNDRSKWSKYQYGKYILIKHGNNLTTLYAHLSKQSVYTGKTVKRGEVIGYSGNTGYSTGAHLHFGVYWSSSVAMKSVPPAAGLVPIGVVVNPEDYL